MMKKSEHSGFAIALAWPETYCKQSSVWYDVITAWLGITKNKYYKAGHSALILIDPTSGSCFYYDFGRYHAPFHHGRVRSATSDDDLIIHTLAEFSKTGELKNAEIILKEVQGNTSCHGEGALYASESPIDLDQARLKADQLQGMSPLEYGPFEPKGTNCSRFVNQVLLAGIRDPKIRFKLRYFVPLTPTPMNNVHALGRELKLFSFREVIQPFPAQMPDNFYMKSTLPAPPVPPALSSEAQWLSGEGAGSWFVVEPSTKFTKVSRFSPQGELECSGLFERLPSAWLSHTKSIQITYPSHCSVVSLSLETKKIELSRISD